MVKAVTGILGGWALAWAVFATGNPLQQPERIAHHASNPAVHGHTVCLTDRQLACFDTSSDSAVSRPAWSIENSAGFDAPVLTSHAVLTGGNQGVYSFARASGKQIWRSAGARTFSPTVYRSVVYAASVDGKLRALRLTDGSQIWARQFDGWIYAPAALGDKIYTGGQSGEVFALDARTGQTLWQRAVPQELVFRPVTGQYDDIIVTTFAGDLISLDAANGQLRWHKKDPVAAHSPVADADRIAYLALDKKLRVRNAANGALLWQSTSEFAGNQPVSHESHLMVLSAQAEPVVLDAATGAELARFAARGATPETPLAPIQVDQTLISFSFEAEPGVKNGTARKLLLNRHALLRRR